MKVALLQTDIVWEDPAANFARLAPQLATAAGAGARLVALPEMFACGFSMRTDVVAEPVDGPSATFLRDQARALGVWIAGSVPERRDGESRPHNTLLLCGPGGEVTRYRKIHPFTFAREDQHYAAGTERVVVDVEGVRLGLFVCYDLRFADEMWALARDVDAYLFVANWPEKRRHHWTALLLARAIENQAWVLAVNRVGRGGELTYSGDSRVIDPWGEVVASAAADPALVLAEVDPARVRDARASFPVLQDRRGGSGS